MAKREVRPLLAHCLYTCSLLSVVLAGVFSFPNMFFEGVRMQLTRNVHSHMQVSHTLNLGGAGPGSYHFAPTVVGKQTNVGSSGSFPVLLGDISSDGSLVAQIIHEPTANVRCKFQGQSKGRQWVSGQLETDYSGNDFSMGVKGINVNPDQGTGIVVMNYLQKVTSKLALGAEFMYQWQKGGENASFTLAGRWRAPLWVGTASISPAGIFNASYFHALNEKKSQLVATELVLDVLNDDLTATFGYQYNFTLSSFRAQFNTKGQVAAMLEQELFPTISLTMTGLLDHMSGKLKMGIHLNVNN